MAAPRNDEHPIRYGFEFKPSLIEKARGSYV